MMNFLGKLAVIGLALALPASAGAARIKDVATVKGVRDNELRGFGLVFGLDGKGDRGTALNTTLKLSEIYAKLGQNVSAADISARNVAAVLVTATLPPFLGEGERIDVTVSALGASSLQNGILMMTPLQGPDGEVYAIAQGPVSIGSGSAGGAGAQRGQAVHPTVGRIPGGAIIERNVTTNFVQKDETGRSWVTLTLSRSDFTTANEMANTINQQFLIEAGREIARASDAASVDVLVPDAYKENAVAFISQVERLPVLLDSEAKVVINERTGTVIMSGQVRIAPCAISHGDLSLVVANKAGDPAAADGAPTHENRLVELYGGKDGKEGVDLKDVVDALNQIKVAPKDLIAILQALERDHVLHAKLEIM